MEKSKFANLLEKYLSGTASEDEKQLLMSWYDSFDDEQVIVNVETDDEERKIYDRLNQKMDLLVKKPVQKTKVIRMKHFHGFWKVAAAVVILFSGYWGWKHFRPSPDYQPSAIAAHPLTPGHSGAILTLADGTKILLDSVKNGTIALSGDHKVIKNGSQVIYEGSKMEADGPLTYNTMATPKGREFELVLPDGTKVWLNAASSIKYPTVFPRGERVVEVTGEAYFEVSHQADKKGERVPFIVHANEMTVQVLGTHFDVNAYLDEPYTKTVLLEGSVSAREKNGAKAVIIQPGQQAFISNGVREEVMVASADVQKVVAWKNGLFQFNDDPLESILRQISRWYDVEVECAPDKKGLRFNGVISRRSDVEALMGLLSATGVVNFKLENRKLIAY